MKSGKNSVIVKSLEDTLGLCQPGMRRISPEICTTPATTHPVPVTAGYCHKLLLWFINIHLRLKVKNDFFYWFTSIHLIYNYNYRPLWIMTKKPTFHFLMLLLELFQLINMFYEKSLFLFDVWLPRNGRYRNHRRSVGIILINHMVTGRDSLGWLRVVILMIMTDY